MKIKHLLITSAVISLSAVAAMVPKIAAQSEAGGGTRVSTSGNESTFKPRSRPAARHTAPKQTTKPGKTAAAYESDGDKFYDEKDYDSALVAYQSAVKLKPSSHALYRIGWIQNDFGEYAKALAVLNQAIGADPGLAAAYVEKGYALRLLKQTNEALAAFKKGIEINPDSSVARYELGLLYVDMERFNEAAASFNEAIVLRPDYANAYEELGVALRRVGRNPEAINALNKSISLAPDDGGGYMGLGDVYFYGTKEYQKAIDAYMKGLQYESSNHVAAYNIGWAYNDLGNYNEALKWLAQAVKIKPDYSYSYNEMGYAYYKLNQSTSAIESYGKALQYKPDSSAAYFGLGDVYFDDQKNYELAAEKYKSGLAIKPDSPNSLYRLGFCYNDLGRYDEAVTYLTRAKQLKPDSVPSHIELGYAYMKLKRYSEATATLKQAIVLDQKTQLGHYYLGQAYNATGDRNGATGEYRELQRLGSDYAPKLYKLINP